MNSASIPNDKLVLARRSFERDTNLEGLTRCKLETFWRKAFRVDCERCRIFRGATPTFPRGATPNLRRRGLQKTYASCVNPRPKPDKRCQLNRPCDLCYLPRNAQLSPCPISGSDSLPTTSFPHTLHRESFMPISRDVLGRFSTLSFFACDVVIFAADRVYAGGLILHLTKWHE
jgi:hypothetical protein